MKLVYLATPYTRYPHGLDAAFEDAAAIAGALIERGLAVFSPICHSHPIAKHGGIDAVDHELWMRIDREMWDRCDELLVAKMQGWDQSRGIAAEIEYFLTHGKPVTYTDVGSILAPRADPGRGVPNSGSAHPMAAESLRDQDETIPDYAPWWLP